MLLFVGGMGTQEVLVVLSVFLVLPAYALIDILTSQFRDSTNKLIWVVVVILVPLLGSLLYVALGRNQKIKKINRF
jgi:hypothetical protein